MRLRALPAIFALLLISAHLMREGQSILILPCLALGGLAFLRRAWTVRTLQTALALAALEWIRTLLLIREARLEAGLPWLRMSLILGGVAAFTLWAAWLLRPEPKPLAEGAAPA
ncbi:MAG: hypothetical protein HYZ13_01360 [Acidobacteria bacterium]|nr:hypothetical protein [Acidobacteriota bacterium]